MKRLFAIILSLLMLASVFPIAVPVSAADKTVYVDGANGNDSGDGLAPSSAFKTLEAAIKAIANDGGKIVLTSDVSLKGSASAQYVEPKHTGKIVITSNDGAKKYSATLRLQGGMVYALNGPTEFADLAINSGSGKTVIAARFNELVMGEGLTFSAANTCLLGGYQTASAGTPTNKNSYVTVKSGSYDFIVGFSRDRSGGNLTYTGTSNISIYGGTVKTVYGASTLYHFSGSTNINIYGGTVSSVNTGGDATRRLNGTSNIGIYGGKITAININNAIGDTTMTLDGGSVTRITESIYQNNSEITNLASGALRMLSYNSVAYTESQIAKLAGNIFDSISVYGHAYVKQGASGDGKSAASPVGDLAAAINLVAGGGEVEIIGDYTLSDFTEPAHNGVITIVSDNGSLTIGSYTLAGPTTFDLPTSGDYTVNADGNTFSTGKSFAASGKVTVYGTVDLNKDSAVYIGGGEIHAVYASKNGQAAEKNGVIDVSGGKVKTAAAAENSATNGSISIFVNGGEIEKAIFDGTNGSITLSAQMGKLGAVSAESVSASSGNSLSYNTDTFDGKLFDGIRHLFTSVSNVKTVYVKDGSNGNGLSANSPTDLATAFTLLKDSGGILVICGTTTVSKTVSTAATASAVTVTSVDGDTDYRKTGAKLVLGSDLSFGGAVLIENLNVTLGKSAPRISFNANDSTIGDNVVMDKPAAYEKYPNIVCGKSASYSGGYTVTVKSGSYNNLYLTNDAANTKITSLNASLIIDGGSFYGPVNAAGNGSCSGSVSVTINGGVLHAGIYGCGNNADATFSGDMKYVLNGGKIIGKIAPAFLSSAMLNGDMYLELNGGEFSSVTDILGPDEFKGRMKPHVTVGSDVDIFAHEEGTASYQNPVTKAGDPWVTYRDGYYYFTKTAGSSIGVAKAANLGDLAYAQFETVFKPASGQMYSKSLWSPELHYFSADDFDNEHFTEDMEGWYLLVACDDGNNKNHRMYVLKALTDDPQGEYGHPVTKAVNVPAKITSDTDDTVNANWTIGQTFAKINNQLYCFWVSEKMDGNRRYQTMHISMMKNPWTATGKTAIVCEPTEPWEKHGATYTPSADGTIYPEVVEGIAIVNGPNGEVFMLYCGSGYWTTEYCLGQLKLVGDDPISYESWYKYPQPILTKNTEMNGTGHCCYTTSPDGSINYIVYHAYMGNSNQGDRFMIAEEYTVTADGVQIGKANGKPAPLATVFEAKVNPMPLVKKLKGWGKEIADFMSFENITVGIGSVISPIPTLSNGDGYSAEKYGTVEYEYKPKNEITEYLTGLPSSEAAGEYTVKAKLVGNDNYSGFTASFTIVIDASAPIVTEAPDTTAQNDPAQTTSPVNTGTIVIIISCVAVVAAIIALIVFTKKK